MLVVCSSALSCNCRSNYRKLVILTQSTFIICIVLCIVIMKDVTLQNCLGIIYTAYVDRLPMEIETLVGNILGCVQAPPPGGPQFRFSIGAGDRQALQPPLCSTIPSTRITVAMLFEQLGALILTVVGLSEKKHTICQYLVTFG